MSAKVGPNALAAELAKLGLKIVKVDNVPANIGKRPELVACEHFDIRIAWPKNRWLGRPREIEQSAPPMPETPMLGDGA